MRLQSTRLGDWKNVRLGLKLGLIMATVFSSWVTVVRVAGGPAAFDRFGLSWLTLVALYFGSLCLGGSRYGALLPLKRHALGSILIWFLFLLPPYVAFATAIGVSLQRIPSLRVGFVIGLIAALLTGGALGLLAWSDERNDAGDGAAPHPGTTQGHADRQDVRPPKREG